MIDRKHCAMCVPAAATPARCVCNQLGSSSQMVSPTNINANQRGGSKLPHNVPHCIHSWHYKLWPDLQQPDAKLLCLASCIGHLARYTAPQAIATSYKGACSAHSLLPLWSELLKVPGGCDQEQRMQVSARHKAPSPGTIQVCTRRARHQNRMPEQCSTDSTAQHTVSKAQCSSIQRKMPHFNHCMGVDHRCCSKQKCCLRQRGYRGAIHDIKPS